MELGQPLVLKTDSFDLSILSNESAFKIQDRVSTSSPGPQAPLLSDVDAFFATHNYLEAGRVRYTIQ